MPGGGNAHAGDTKIQFHNDQVKFLVCHETQIAIYDASEMELIRRVSRLFPRVFFKKKKKQLSNFQKMLVFEIQCQIIIFSILYPYRKHSMKTCNAS
jgi:hypothetical protein